MDAHGDKWEDRHMSGKAAAVVVAVVVAIGALFVMLLGAPGAKKSVAQPVTCTTATVPFKMWLADQSSLYGEDLQARYGIQSVSAECGDVTVSTLIAEDSSGLAEGACNVLSGAVSAVPSVESVTVVYGTGRNACFQWPGGPSNF